MLQRKFFVVLVISVLLFSSLGCILAGRTAQIATPTPVATEDLTPLETQVESAVKTAVSGGRVTLEFTEGQLTSAANQELASQGESRIRDLQIRLDDGLMNISGQVEQNGLDLPLTISLKINVDSQGRPHTQIVSGKVGPFSLPQNMLDQITTQIDTMLQSQLDSSAQALFVESIGIDNGVITVVAQLK
jgi:uncharacterized protein YpmS